MDIKKIVKEGFEPISNATIGIAGVSTIEHEGKAPFLAHESEQTTVDLSEVHLNGRSEPYVEGQKRETSTGFELIDESTIDIKRVMGTRNSTPQNRQVIDAITINF